MSAATLTLEVTGVGSFSPGHTWAGTTAAARLGLTEAVLATSLLPLRARGRASPLTLMFAHVIEQAVAQAGADIHALPIIYGSAYGEMTTTLRLLEMLHEGDGRLSPARFQASVHNTAAGQISIAQGNRQFTTSLAAGHDTLAMCLVEAWSWLAAHGQQVLVVCADEQAPSVLEPSAGYEALAVAFLLECTVGGQRSLARLSALGPRPGRGIPPAPSGNPCLPGLNLLTAMVDPAARDVILNPVSDLPWQVHVQPTAIVPGNAGAPGNSGSESP
jgi:hypothetical protein